MSSTEYRKGAASNQAWSKKAKYATGGMMSDENGKKQTSAKKQMTEGEKRAKALQMRSLTNTKKYQSGGKAGYPKSKMGKC